MSCCSGCALMQPAVTEMQPMFYLPSSAPWHGATPTQRKGCLLLMHIKHHMGSWCLYLSHSKGLINVLTLINPFLPSSLQQLTPLLLKCGQASSQSPDPSLLWSHKKQRGLNGHPSWEENSPCLLFYRDFGLRIRWSLLKPNTVHYSL